MRRNKTRERHGISETEVNLYTSSAMLRRVLYRLFVVGFFLAILAVSFQARKGAVRLSAGVMGNGDTGAPVASCGDGICTAPEDCTSCKQDCGQCPGGGGSSANGGGLSSSPLGTSSAAGAGAASSAGQASSARASSAAAQSSPAGASSNGNVSSSQTVCPANSYCRIKTHQSGGCFPPLDCLLGNPHYPNLTDNDYLRCGQCPPGMTFIDTNAACTSDSCASTCFSCVAASSSSANSSSARPCGASFCTYVNPAQPNPNACTNAGGHCVSPPTGRGCNALEDCWCSIECSSSSSPQSSAASSVSSANSQNSSANALSSVSSSSNFCRYLEYPMPPPGCRYDCGTTDAFTGCPVCTLQCIRQSSSSSSSSVIPRCGNGIREPGEECDDGNTAGGDCCSQVCKIENGCVCRLRP